MLKTVRRISAIVFFLGITLLFLDFTGVTHAWLSWMARMQFLPAVLSGSVVIVASIVVFTLLFGRAYCSVICPLGVMQDGFAWIGRRFKRNRYRYSKAISWLRYTMLAVLIVAIFQALTGLVAVLAPYSTFGRIAGSIFSPLALTVNNWIASLMPDSYTVYHHDVWIKSLTVFAISLASLVVIGLLAYRNGRTWCNTVCPVGTVLGLLSRYSLFKVRIDTSKCVNCGLCSRNCKAACIDFKQHKIDYSRCVNCMDCLDKCSTGALYYGIRKKTESEDNARQSSSSTDKSRRAFLSATGVIGVAMAADAKKKVDGGLAVIEDKKITRRVMPIVPPGAGSVGNVSHHCTACQLCITACPNKVLRPSSSVDRFMQPESGYERGYCRPECTRCSHVCPTGAIRPITTAEKTAISIGHAVWIKDNCIAATSGINCNSCERHCPAGAITRVPLDPDDPGSPLIPAVDTSRCIGCGACEYYCPARPVAAIYVEGNARHIKL